MRISKVTNAVNWRYAVGELFLIVAGILIALAAADWNERRLVRQQELALLHEIRSGLVADLQNFETALSDAVEAKQRILALQGLFADPPPYDSSMDTLFGAVYGIRFVNLHTSAYDTLKSTGLQMISNDELRLDIARIFDQHYEVITGNNAIEVGINRDVLRPYYLPHFRDLQFWESATPLDYDAVIVDPYYHNIVGYRLAVMDNNLIGRWPEVIEDIQALLRLLDEEIGPPLS